MMYYLGGFLITSIILIVYYQIKNKRGIFFAITHPTLYSKLVLMSLAWPALVIMIIVQIIQRIFYFRR